MEQIIIIGLLIILVLVFVDKKNSISISGRDDIAKTKNLRSIMGDAKQIERQILPTDTNERQKQSTVMEEDNFEKETREEFDKFEQIKNLDDILGKNGNWEQQDEDWKYQDSTIESGFATGVTFQELSTAGQLLQQDLLEPDLAQQAVDIVQKIQGTELFDLLENSLGDASKRIADLLSASISKDDQIISSERSNSSDSFDIGEFV
ncbi:hypothetical protein [Chryseobacterium sp.]|uniref:hypothetical protein n=1 Tax=Chryseobacterium sp. TaxID=1871047 RepID=UPI0025BE79CB|nr:hypothetical protein [Chryseobacterium sp.]MBV8326708.1 hypothetical protein [Chryseobacterium sp.]